MLVSNRNKFIYTKTIKTAGTSVESYFEQYCMAPDEWELAHTRAERVSRWGIIGCRSGDPFTIQASVWWNHMPAITIKSLLGPEIWNSYFKFCVLRNPFDKAVSAYCHPDNSRPKAQSLAPANKLKADFQDWLVSGNLPIDRNKYLINGKLCIDSVIRYENLTNDIKLVSDKLGITYQPEDLPVLKSGSRPTDIPLREYYSARSIEVIQETYRFELDTFEYDFPD